MLGPERSFQIRTWGLGAKVELSKSQPQADAHGRGRRSKGTEASRVGYKGQIWCYSLPMRWREPSEGTTTGLFAPRTSLTAGEKDAPLKIRHLEGDGNITGLVAQPMLSCLPFLLLSRFCHCKYVPPQLRSHQSDRLNSGRHFGATQGNRAVNWFCGLDGRTHGWMEAAWNIRETAPYLESRETNVGEGGARLGSWKRQPSRQVVSAKQILRFHTTGCAIGFAMAVGRSRFP